MSAFKVALCHQTVTWGDAIGHDIARMYGLLERLGGEPVIVCESHRRQSGELKSIRPEELDCASLSLLIYHHSQYWAAGESLVHKTSCPVIFRYHNITPAHFFAPYSARHSSVCVEGRKLTQRFLAIDRKHIWLADSIYNRDELEQSGAHPSRLFVAPPFNRSQALLGLEHCADYSAETVNWLLVGRLAPNKGHVQLLRVAQAFRSRARKVHVTLVGASDPEVDGYYNVIRTERSRLGLEGCIELRSHCSDAELIDLFRRSHIYVCFSEHEGFCVPIVEAQAIGLPVIGSAATAMGETAGPDQLLSDPPRAEEDYAFYAALAEQVIDDGKLREQIVRDGERNVRERFTDEPIENAFVGAVHNLLHSS
jgi:glycosyltransferase involved in cell wall biosynthesis